MIADALPEYVPALKFGGCFVSIVAGCSVATIAGFVGDAAVVKVMPNISAMVGVGVSGMFANEKCTKRRLADVIALITLNGTCVQLVNGDKIDRLTAVSGSGLGNVLS
ncbi:MAG: pyrroline-5-carboxylate reductase [Alteromonas macleodii]|jgi:pyrroline-5-carboxylate reductase